MGLLNVSKESPVMRRVCTHTCASALSSPQGGCAQLCHVRRAMCTKGWGRGDCAHTRVCVCTGHGLRPGVCIHVLWVLLCAPMQQGKYRESVCVHACGLARVHGVERAGCVLQDSPPETPLHALRGGGGRGNGPGCPPPRPQGPGWAQRVKANTGPSCQPAPAGSAQRPHLPTPSTPHRAAPRPCAGSPHLLLPPCAPAALQDLCPPLGFRMTSDLQAQRHGLR